MKKEINVLIADKSLSILTAEEEKVIREAESIINEKWMELSNSKEVVDAFKKYASTMEKAGYPYR